MYFQLKIHKNIIKNIIYNIVQYKMFKLMFDSECLDFIYFQFMSY